MFTTSDNVKIDFIKTYLGAIVPTESRNGFEETEEKKEGSQAIFKNWQIIRMVTKLYNKRVSTCKFCFLFGEGGGGFKKNGLLNFTWERQNEFLARQV